MNVQTLFTQIYTFAEHARTIYPTRWTLFHTII